MKKTAPRKPAPVASDDEQGVCSEFHVVHDQANGVGAKRLPMTSSARAGTDMC